MEKANKELTECLEKEREFRKKAESELGTRTKDNSALNEKNSALETKVNRSS